MNNDCKINLYIEEVLCQSSILINSVGYRKFQLKKLISLLNFSRNTFYNFFGNKLNIIGLVLLSQLYKMKEFIGENLESDLNYESCIGQIIQLRNVYIKNEPLLNKYFFERSLFCGQLKNVDMKYQLRENEILTSVLCKYYQKKENSLMFLGRSFKEIWSDLFSFDCRNHICSYMFVLENSFSKI